MRHDQDATGWVIARNGVERRGRSRDRGFDGFETGRSSIRRQVAGPIAIDFVRSETLPFAGVVLAPTFVDGHAITTNDIGDQSSRDTSSFQIARHDGVEGRAFRCQQSGRRFGLRHAEIGQRRVGLPLPTAQRVPCALAVP